MFLEEKKISYRVGKVTMFCYGDKEPWYLRNITRRGMLPAIALDGKVVVESDVILEKLESAFGKLNGISMFHEKVKELRKLERTLFRAWCQWLCYPSSSAGEEVSGRTRFVRVANCVDKMLSANGGPFFFGKTLTIADIGTLLNMSISPLTSIVLLPFSPLLSIAIFSLCAVCRTHERQPLLL